MTLLSFLFITHQNPSQPKLVSQGLEGYISMNVPAPPDDFGYGVSLYATAWPLVEKPLRDFQIGLASIWIVPENRKIEYPLLPHGTLARDNWPERGPSYRDVFQTIEGGLGFWGDTWFGDVTAKFRMNGTANGYNHEISTPGWGFGGGPGGVALQPDQMGIAQLSNHLLVPPDGITFKDGTCGDLLGYAWMVLPLAEPKAVTAGLPVTTGNQCWTLFLNSKNFRGPVAFYTPVTWSRISRNYAPAVGRGLDTRPGLVTGGAIEVNTVPRFVGTDANGEYTKIPRLQFPADRDGRTILIHNLTHYSKAAIYDQVSTWLQGGPTPTGQFDRRGSQTPSCKANPLSLQQGPDRFQLKGLDRYLVTKVFDETAFGFQWNPSVLERWKGGVWKGSFPQYAKRDGKSYDVQSDVPADTGLRQAQFLPATTGHTYTSPATPGTVWRKPGPAAGPFKAKLADGSTVTYYWYRFIDQPSLQDADLSEAEKARLQSVVEKIQRSWTSKKEYMAPPKVGALTTLDNAILVNPPKGLEVGYVPIATGQADR